MLEERAEEGKRSVELKKPLTHEFTEERVRALLEEARRSVKHIVQRELESENVGSDLLNLRLK
jgi:hypothetical protein